MMDGLTICSGKFILQGLDSPRSCVAQSLNKSDFAMLACCVAAIRHPGYLSTDVETRVGGDSVGKHWRESLHVLYVEQQGVYFTLIVSPFHCIKPQVHHSTLTFDLTVSL